MAGQEIQKSGPQPINIFLASLHSRLNSERNETPEQRELKAQKDDAILVLLAQLALVYWRPDFTPGQAKQLYAQFLDDLRDLPFSSVAEAVERYRREPANKFYPTPGQLRGLITTPPSWWVSGQKEWMKDVRDDNAAEMKQLCSATVARLAAE